MGIESRKKTIGAHTYTVEQFGAKEGGRVLVRIAKMLGGAVGEAASMADAASLGGKLDVIGKVFSNFTDHVSEDDYDYLCDKFSPKTRVTGGDYGEKEPKLSDYFDSHFAGAYWDMAQWLAFAFEVNYGSFLAVMTEQAKKAKTADQPPPDSGPVEKPSSLPSRSQSG